MGIMRSAFYLSCGIGGRAESVEGASRQKRSLMMADYVFLYMETTVLGDDV